jgi:cellulose synthase/poly-beta-1,6-N-acetylglucosamine synthase-like glycosyltransferase
MLTSVLNILFGCLFIYCALSVAYLFILAIWGKFFYSKKYNGVSAKPGNSIAVMVPAYREDGIILSTANNLMRLDYPSELFDVYIIADSFQPATIQSLGELPIHVIEVGFDNKVVRS